MTNLQSLRRFRPPLPLAAFGSLLLALGCEVEPSLPAASDVELASGALDTVYPAQLQNCTNCANGGTYIDLNAGGTLRFLNVNGGTGGTATLRFSMTSPSGVRTMGVFVNGSRVGKVSTTTTRPTFAEASITASLTAGAANTVELRDTEGATEPDVASLKVVTGSTEPTTRYEAENATTLQNAVAKTLAGASGGRYVDGNAGAHLSWSVTGAGGTQTIRFAVSSPGGARSLRVTVNQGVVGVLTTSAAGFNWEVKSFSAYLHAGANYIDLWDLENTAEPDVDYLEVAPASQVGVTATAGVGGKISPSGAVQVTQGGSKDFTFTPDPNMRVKRICYPTATTCFAYTSNTWTLSPAAAGQTVKVEFEYVPGAACGDGVCNNRESVDTCAADCTVTDVSGRRGPHYWNNATLRGDSRAFYGNYLDSSAGASMGYQLTTSAGWYRLSFSVTSSSGVSRMGVFVNNTKVGVVQSGATAWNWETVSVTAKLIAGLNNIELRDTEGTAEFDLEYFDWTNNVFGTRDGGFGLGWGFENGGPVFTELVTFERPSYLTPHDAGAWWIIDLFAHNVWNRTKYLGSVTDAGLYVRDCVTGEWWNASGTMFRASGSPLSDQGSTYNVDYYPLNTTIDSHQNPILLDAKFACPGPGAPETEDIIYPVGSNTTRTVLGTGFQSFALVVKHH